MSKQIEIALQGDGGQVSGFCDDRFSAVRDAFVANFDAGEELGASVCINVAGETVVDLWGGRRHPKQARRSC